MTTLKAGALFAGYGGIELALDAVLGTRLEWVAEVDPGPSRILAHHWPDVPNLGDVTKVRWSPDCPDCEVPTYVTRDRAFMAAGYECHACDRTFTTGLRDEQMRRDGVDIAEPVDVMGGGSPCQDLSHAGKRQGMKAGTRSGLWASMCDAIEIIRPRLVVWENVRGAYSAAADSAVEPCPFCVGDEPGVTLRALGRVLGDLAELGYDARWHGLRAADVGAPHGRFRVFVFATPADADLSGLQERRNGGGIRAAQPGPRTAAHGGSGPLPPAADGLTLLPTPAVNDMGACHTPESWDEWTARMKAEHGNGNGHGKSLAVEAQRLLPTPTSSDTSKHAGQPAEKRAGHHLRLTDATECPQDWSIYGPAVARWETLTRPAPDPTEPGTKGQPRLSPRFVEWMMGLPDGWVTDPAIWHGLTNAKGRTLTGTQLVNAARNHQLKALGNGVVWQQCAAALAQFLADERAWREAAAS